MNIDVRDSRMTAIVAKDAEVERLATGFDFTEGPVWHPHEKHLPQALQHGQRQRL